MSKILILFLCLFLVDVAESISAGPVKGTIAPDFVGRTIEGKLYKLSRDKGEAKVVNFFWVYCEPCKKEMPELAGLEKKYPKFKFISVHTYDSDGEKVEEFLKVLPSHPSNIVLAGNRIKGDYKYPGLPHTVVMDKDNKVLFNLVGFSKGNMVKLEELLKSF